MFKEAKPIWLKNMSTACNLQVGFRCDFDADRSKEYILKIAGATFYKVYLNGCFIAFGPARAPHGYNKFDEICLPVQNGSNKLAVEAAGYNCASFYTIKRESFLCAEIAVNNEVKYWTGKDFSALSLEKLRNVCSARYSYQRAYGEVWHYDNAALLTNWKTADFPAAEKTEVLDIPWKYIPRNLPLPEYNTDEAVCICETGNIEHKQLNGLDKVRYLSHLSNYIDGFRQEELPENPIVELYGDFIPKSTAKTGICPQLIQNGEYVIFEMKTDNTGFLINEITAMEDSSVYIFFAEYNYGNGMIFESLAGQCNIIKYTLKKSDTPYFLESFEPYVCKYIGVAVKKGKISVGQAKIREYSYPFCNNAVFEADDEKLNMIFEASKNTFRQNTLDVFMDCPGRERAGWLCDSRFTAWSEKFFSGKNIVEKEFLKSFVTAKNFPNVPDGMIPMIYPGEIPQYRWGFIPQWAMWYIIEVGERCSLREDDDGNIYKNLCYSLLEWFEHYENNDGLLERLPGWNFVEWSDANKWTDDVNYPTNMLYSKVLSVVGELYGDSLLKNKSRQVADTVISQSFDGHFFIDNAVRDKSGILKITENRSEVCQYYAYFTGIASFKDERFAALTDTVTNVFGPGRKAAGKMKNIAYANAFIGNYLRMIILQENGLFDKCINEIKQYFYKMAEITGTLWEHDDLQKAKAEGSLNHGFASYIGVILPMACSGISKINYNEKKVYVCETYTPKFGFDFTLNTENGEINVSVKANSKRISVPPSWIIEYTG